MGKVKKQHKNKHKNNRKSAQPIKRNSVALNPLLRKSHVHVKSKKADRQQGKKDLTKALEE